MRYWKHIRWHVYEFEKCHADPTVFKLREQFNTSMNNKCNCLWEFCKIVKAHYCKWYADISTCIPTDPIILLLDHAMIIIVVSYCILSIFGRCTCHLKWTFPVAMSTTLNRNPTNSDPIVATLSNGERSILYMQWFTAINWDKIWRCHGWNY